MFRMLFVASRHHDCGRRDDWRGCLAFGKGEKESFFDSFRCRRYFVCYYLKSTYDEGRLACQTGKSDELNIQRHTNILLQLPDAVVA